MLQKKRSQLLTSELLVILNLIPVFCFVWPVCFSSPSGILAQERKLCRDLVHSNKKEQEFRSIFHHIQSAQSQRSPSELFAQHIVTIVHHVRGGSESVLRRRFAPLRCPCECFSCALLNAWMVVLY